jgi:hypothetical protein
MAGARCAGAALHRVARDLRGRGTARVLSASEAFWAVASLLACAATLHIVLRGGAVDSERIYAALRACICAPRVSCSGLSTT